MAALAPRAQTDRAMTATISDEQGSALKIAGKTRRRNFVDIGYVRISLVGKIP
jgi:hypothetical protein